MTVLVPRRSSGNANGIGMPLPIKDDQSDYKSPLQYLESVSAAKPLPKKPSLFLNTTFTAAVLVACLATAATVWFWPRQPHETINLQDVQSTLSSFEEAIESLSRFQTSDIRDVAFPISATSSSSEQAHIAVQRWIDLQPVVNSIEDLLAQRKSKVSEAQHLESKLRVASAAYQSAREASELFSSSAKTSVNSLQKNRIDQDTIQLSINGTKDHEVELQKKLQQHDQKISDLNAKRSATEKQVISLEKAINEQQSHNEILSDNVKYYLSQVNQHNASVANASNDLKSLLRLQDSLSNEIAEKKLLLENLRSKEKEKTDLLSTIESIQRQFAVIAKENPHDEATVSLKALMDAEEQQIESLNDELSKVLGNLAKSEIDDIAYESSLHRSRIRLQRVQHELRYESIRFIYESLPVGTSRTFPAVLAIVDNHIEQARDRLDQIKFNISTAQNSLTAAEKHISENAAQIERLRTIESDADARYAMLVASLNEAESAHNVGQQTVNKLNSEYRQLQDALDKIKLDYEAAVEQKRSYQKELLILADEQLSKQNQLQQLQNESLKSIELCIQDVTVAHRHLKNLNSKFDEVQQLSKTLSTLSDVLVDLDQHLQQRSQRLLDALNSGMRYA